MKKYKFEFDSIREFNKISSMMIDLYKKQERIKTEYLDRLGIKYLKMEPFGVAIDAGDITKSERECINRLSENATQVVCCVLGIEQIDQIKESQSLTYTDSAKKEERINNSKIMKDFDIPKPLLDDLTPSFKPTPAKYNTTTVEEFRSLSERSKPSREENLYIVERLTDCYRKLSNFPDLQKRIEEKLLAALDKI